MSIEGALRYYLGTGIGKGVLRFERLRNEWRLRHRAPKTSSPFSPPLSTSPWLKELISRHYLTGRYADAHRKVAWVTSGAPVEFLKALGYYLLYPENHGAVCGIRRRGEELCQAAEEAGYSRDICSYARTDLGSLLSGRTPVGRLPKPDLLLCCTNICQTVLFWYRVLAAHFRVPLVIIDTPFIYSTAPAHAVDFVQRQLELGVETAERVAGRSIDPAELERVTRRSREAVELWMRVLERARHVPAPITAFDEFIHMGPIVEMRGDRATVDYYRALLATLDLRIARGTGALKQERIRLIWDNLPIWYRMRGLSELLARHGATLVASTYTNAWGELAALIDPSDPMRSAARVYLHPILNRGTGHKLDTIQRLATDYAAHGVILHSDRSCKPYSVGQMDQRERLSARGIPALLLEADHNDPRAFADEQAENRIQAFLEMIPS
ncbi:MAG: 2-hydroxyacyl-CoA dehydratase [Deltaproteobacteria bacterium]|nr:2-hydroxyacyl-CoA dehydratase [Deltaproteobacteria bacterium]